MSEFGVIVLFFAGFIAPITAFAVVFGGWWLGVQMHWWDHRP